MTTSTSQLIDATYDALTLMNMLCQRLAKGEINNREASDMSWLVGSARKRLNPVADALEELEQKQRLQNDVDAITSEIKSLEGRLADLRARL